MLWRMHGCRIHGMDAQVTYGIGLLVCNELLRVSAHLQCIIIIINACKPYLTASAPHLQCMCVTGYVGDVGGVS
jgi:hypothetical protein